ncbi:MAG: hypothetical protein D6798_07330 [Deltaproteobacteria bacterium]|nr:MAG: hypothetical protein D6798_07330 [Deltaproteobacteria bacterium]
MATLTPARFARAAWYLALALLVTWPVVLHPVDTVLGHPQASAACHVWVLWWARHHVTEIVTPLLFFPYGADVVTLYGSDVLSPLLLRGLPLPPTLLYNLWVVLLLVVGGLGVDGLARDRGATEAGGLLAGTVFATAPFLQHEALNGTSEIIGIAALAWFLRALFAVLDRRDDGSWRRPSRHTVVGGLALGLSFSLAVALSAYNLFFGLVAAGVLTVARLATSPTPVFRREQVQALAAAAVGASPIGAFLLWLQRSHGAAEVYSRRGNWKSDLMALPDAFASLEMWVDPRPATIPVVQELPFGEVFEYWTTCTVYLGLVALGLGVIGAWRGRRRAPVGSLVALAVVAALIASGPYLRVQGEPVTVLGLRVPMPSLVLADLFPPFVITAVHAYRYAGLVVIALALLAGLAVRRWPAAVAAGCLVLGDAVLLSPVPWPAPVTQRPRSAVLDALAAAPDGGVLHVPIEAEHLGDLGRLLLAQTVHGKPVQDGGIHRRAGVAATTAFREIGLLAGLEARGAPRLPGEKQGRFDLGQLYNLGYRYVLLEEGEESPDVEAWLERLLGPADEADERWRLWRLEPERIVGREGSGRRP